MSKRLYMKKFLLFFILTTSIAFAKSAPKTHDGFFINGTLGSGYGNYLDEFKNEGVKIKSEGAQLETGFKIGAAVIQNLILHGTINVTAFLSDLQASNKYGEEASLVLDDDDFLETIFLGGGITYYIPGESNIYISASAGMTRFTELCILGKKITEHDINFGFNVSIGKEWWINNELGIGAALSYKQSSTNTKFLDYKGETSFRSISLVASITFN